MSFQGRGYWHPGYIGLNNNNNNNNMQWTNSVSAPAKTLPSLCPLLSVPFSMSPLSLSPSLCPPTLHHRLYVPLTLSPCLCNPFSFTLSLSPTVCPPLSASTRLSPSHCLSISLSLYLTIWSPPSAFLDHSHFLSLSLSHCLTRLLVSASQLILHADQPASAVLLELCQLLPGGEGQLEGLAIRSAPLRAGGCRGAITPRLEIPFIFSKI